MTSVDCSQFVEKVLNRSFMVQLTLGIHTSNGKGLSSIQKKLYNLSSYRV